MVHSSTSQSLKSCSCVTWQTPALACAEFQSQQELGLVWCTITGRSITPCCSLIPAGAGNFIHLHSSIDHHTSAIPSQLFTTNWTGSAAAPAVWLQTLSMRNKNPALSQSILFSLKWPNKDAAEPMAIPRLRLPPPGLLG